ncbi:MAG: hypothetical protein IJV27_11850 [Prevotella sp.]|nr:hypothetical protein [Prevotella sp.]
MKQMANELNTGGKLPESERQTTQEQNAKQLKPTAEDKAGAPRLTRD